MKTSCTVHSTNNVHTVFLVIDARAVRIGEINLGPGVEIADHKRFATAIAKSFLKILDSGGLQYELPQEMWPWPSKGSNQ